MKNILIFLFCFMVICVFAGEKFKDNGDGTVEDTSTGLVWQKCTVGQKPLNCKGDYLRKNWPDAMNYCIELKLADKIWRLPSKEEIMTLVDKSYSDPVIDTSVFPNTHSWFYHTSSPFGLVYNQYAVNFRNGASQAFETQQEANVRCVTGLLKK